MSWSSDSGISSWTGTSTAVSDNQSVASYEALRKRGRRTHECDVCRGLSKMPSECERLSNTETQARSRKRKNDVANDYNMLQSECNIAKWQNGQLGATTSHLLRVLSGMAHFCGWKAQPGYGGLPDNLNDILFSISREEELFGTFPKQEGPENGDGPNYYVEYCSEVVGPVLVNCSRRSCSSRTRRQ